MSEIKVVPCPRCGTTNPDKQTSDLVEQAAPPRPLENSARYGSEPAFQTGDKFVDIVLPLYNEWVKTDGKEGFKDANEACVLFAAWVLFQRQPAAPAAIEQARPQPPRCPTCNSAIRPAGMSFCQDNFHAAAAEPAPERTPPQMKWQCEVCGRRYAEYVNGCPACWERNIRARVVSVVTANKKWSELYGKLSLKRRAAIEARVAGEVARIEKKPYDVNPFPGGSELFKEWQTGYYDADEAILARAVAVPEPADKQDKKPLDSRWENAADLKKETSFATSERGEVEDGRQNASRATGANLPRSKQSLLPKHR